MSAIHPHLDVTLDQIEAYCRKWQIVRFELFGSVLRDDFDDESDIDVLVTFAPGAVWTFRDDLAMEEELSAMLRGRHVDVVERRHIESHPNWVRRRAILTSAQTVYAAA